MTNKEKRYVEVDVNWDDENKVWYEYDGDGSYNTYSTTATLTELIIKEHPWLREEFIKALLESRKYTHVQLDKAGIRGVPELYVAHQADSILSILGIKKEG